MEPRSRFGVSGAVILGGLLVGVVFFGLRPGSVEVTYDNDPPVTAPESGEAVVATLRASGGFAPFGVRIVDRTHRVGVQFITGPGCAELLTGEEPWPTPYDECSTLVGVTGTVSGTGIDASGRSLVGVEFAVARACFDQLDIGMPWPTDLASCAEAG